MFYYQSSVENLKETLENAKRLFSGEMALKYYEDNRSYPTLLEQSIVESMTRNGESILQAASEEALTLFVTSSGILYEHGYRPDTLDDLNRERITRKVEVKDRNTGEKISVRKVSIGLGHAAHDVQVAVITDHGSVLLRDGSYSEFKSIHGESTLLHHTKIVDVSVGSGFGVLISANGSLYAWGDKFWINEHRNPGYNREKYVAISGGDLDAEDERGPFKAWKIAYTVYAMHVLGRNGKIVSLGNSEYAGFPELSDTSIRPTLHNESDIQHLKFVDIASNYGGTIFLVSDRKTLVTLGPSKNGNLQRFLGIRNADEDRTYPPTIMDALGHMEERLHKKGRIIIDIATSSESGYVLLDDGSMWILGWSHVQGFGSGRHIWLDEWTELRAYGLRAGIQAFSQLSIEVDSIFSIEGQIPIDGDYMCFGKGSLSADVCSGRGTCMGHDDCLCFSGYGPNMGAFTGDQCHECEVVNCYWSLEEEVPKEICNRWDGEMCNQRIGGFHWSHEDDYLEGILFLGGDQSAELDCNLIFSMDTLQALGGERFTRCIWPSRFDTPIQTEAGKIATVSRNSSSNDNGKMRLYVPPFIPRHKELVLELVYPGMSHESITVEQQVPSQPMILLPIFLSTGSVLLAITGIIISFTADIARKRQEKIGFNRDLLIFEAVNHIRNQYNIIVSEEEIELAGERFEKVNSALTNNSIRLDTIRLMHPWFTFVYPPTHVEQHLTILRRFAIIISALLMHLACVQFLVYVFHSRILNFHAVAVPISGKLVSSLYFPWIIPVCMFITTIVNGIQEVIARLLVPKKRNVVIVVEIIFGGFISLLAILVMISIIFLSKLRMTNTVLMDWGISVGTCWLLEAIVVRTVIGIAVTVKTWKNLRNIHSAAITHIPNDTCAIADNDDRRLNDSCEIQEDDIELMEISHAVKRR